MTIDSMGTDLRLKLLDAALRPVYTIDLDRRRLSTGTEGPRQMHDLGVTSGRDNLAQAIIVRLLTPRGELAPLGHPEYGSQLHQLIGRVNSAGVRDLVKLHILDSLRHERRIAQVAEVVTTRHPVQRDRLDVSLTVLPLGDTELLEIGPFALDLQP